MQAPAEVRDLLVSALALDLVGPDPGDTVRAAETLPVAPSVWYLTGFLVPFDAAPGEREGDDADGELDGVDKARAGDDEAAPEATAARKGLFPSSIGLSFLVPASARGLTVTACWGDYAPHEPAETDAEHRRTSRWRRTPRSVTRELPLRISAIVNTGIGHREHSGGIGAKRRGGRPGLHRSEATLMGCSGPGVDLLAA